MSPVRITCKRTVAYARNLYATAVIFALYLASSALLFAFRLSESEGGGMMLPSVWALCYGAVLPVFTSLVAMDVWSDERMSGRIEVLMSTAVRERDLVLGKFFGVWGLTTAAVLLGWGASAVMVMMYACDTCEVSIANFLPAVIGLVLQGAVWSSIAVAASSLFKRSAVAGAVAVILTIVLPRGIWAGLIWWWEEGGSAFGDMPLDAHAIDMAAGIVQPSVLIMYAAVVFAGLLTTVKRIAIYRFVGRGAKVLKASTLLTVILGWIAAGLLIVLALKSDAVIELPIGAVSDALSVRTQNILAETTGEIEATIFASRKDSRFREAGVLVRKFRKFLEVSGGAKMRIRIVDPQWDIGEAERLVYEHVDGGSVVFRYHRRLMSVCLNEDFGEEACASAIQRMVVMVRRQRICWIKGHGENSYDDYGEFGMSDIARELAKNGYENATIELSEGVEIPDDCALMIIAGGRDDFSRSEIERLENYLKHSGRLLVLMGAVKQSGIASLLANWGMKPVTASLVGARTLSGTDVIVDEFSDHRVVSSFKGSRVILEKPMAFVAMLVTEVLPGVGKITFSPLAMIGDQVLAAAVERGVGSGEDSGMRPTRVVAVGDSTFVMNSQLAKRASANRDFFLNAVAYLSGVDALTGSGVARDILLTGMDRKSRLNFAIASVFVLPLLVMVFFLFMTWQRRRG